MGILFRQAVMLPVDRIFPNEWNANEQRPETFNMLVEDIEQDGFDESLQVVLWPDCPHLSPDSAPVEYAPNKTCVAFKIIGGEHRWKVLKVAGEPKAPCVVYESWDEAAQKLKTVRRNLLRGELNDVKFTKLVKSLEDSIPREQLPSLLGFASEEEFARHYLAEKTGAAADKPWLEEVLRESAREITMVNGVSDVIHNIFAQYGDTVPQDYMLFQYGGKTHLLVAMDADMFKAVNGIVDGLRESKENINTVLKRKLA